MGYNDATLLDTIVRWRDERNETVCFVTFNYDTMFEQAMQLALGFHPFNIDSYLSLGSYTLVKLHGSINWGRDVEGLSGSFNSDQGYLIIHRAELQISNRYRVVSDCPMLRQDGEIVFPALSIPVEKKDEFFCPENHVRSLEILLPQVEKIMTIGWRATEEDFLAMLRNKVPETPRLLVVSGSADGVEETVRNLSVAPLKPRQPVARVDAGFAGLINIGNCSMPLLITTGAVSR